MILKNITMTLRKSKITNLWIYWKRSRGKTTTGLTSKSGGPGPPVASLTWCGCHMSCILLRASSISLVLCLRTHSKNSMEQFNWCLWRCLRSLDPSDFCSGPPWLCFSLRVKSGGSIDRPWIGGHRRPTLLEALVSFSTEFWWSPSYTIPSGLHIYYYLFFSF